MRLFLTVCVWCSFLFFFLSTATSDTLYLAGGQTIEGTIKSETDTQVVVDVGAGDFTFHKSTILRIEKSDRLDDETEPSVEKGTYSDDIQADIRKLNAMVTKARIKRRLISRYNSELQIQKKKIRKNEDELRPFYKDFEKASGKVAEYTPGERLPIHEWREAHASVAQRDKAVSRIKELEIELSEIARVENEVAKKLSKAQAEYGMLNADMERAFDALLRKDIDGSLRDGLNHVENMIERYHADWDHKKVPLQREGNTYRVEVQLNGKDFYTFLVDTGASAVVITRQMARELGLTEQDEIRTIACKIANGEIVNGKQVVLDSVSVGNMRAEFVDAIILEEIEGKRLDPLLGMSYLGNFHFRIDASSNHIIFDKYKEP
jgi:clan AA aspartic protease (TIGR02281 family)